MILKVLFEAVLVVVVEILVVEHEYNNDFHTRKWLAPLRCGKGLFRSWLAEELGTLGEIPQKPPLVLLDHLLVPACAFSVGDDYHRLERGVNDFGLLKLRNEQAGHLKGQIPVHFLVRKILFEAAFFCRAELFKVFVCSFSVATAIHGAFPVDKRE